MKITGGLTTRRSFLATSTAAAAATHPLARVIAQSRPAPFLRYDVRSAEGIAMLKSYAVAIEAMLKLPPSHPHNWYRNALVHTIDCPHGNWWFLLWHRGYTGLFEQTVRQYSGNPRFAFPYWNWTEDPAVPPQFFEGVLNPKHPAYIESYEKFYVAFQKPVEEWFNNMSSAQLTQAELNKFPTADAFFDAIKSKGFFPDRDKARRDYAQGYPLTPLAAFSVSHHVMDCALAVRSFLDFGSAVTANHYVLSKFSIFEGMAHNKVHNDFEGFMQDNMSPVDPIFMMHHSNIDRLWVEWTAQMEALHLDPLPTEGRDVWEAEPFVFFIGPNGKPAPKQNAGAYLAVDQFNYRYVGGRTGVAATNMLMASAPSRFADQRFEATQSPQVVDPRGAVFNLTLPAPLLKTGPRAASPRDTEFILEVTVEGMPDQYGEELNLFVNPPAGELGAETPGLLASLSFFGLHHHHAASGSVVFEVPFCEYVKCVVDKKCTYPPKVLVVKSQPRNLKAAAGGTTNPLQVTAIAVRGL
jgi:tyrosinase